MGESLGFLKLFESNSETLFSETKRVSAKTWTHLTALADGRHFVSAAGRLSDRACTHAKPSVGLRHHGPGQRALIP